MNPLLKLEELAMLVISLILFWKSPLSGWWLPAFLFPDIGMLGYLVNNKVGAWMYNLFHHRGIAIIIITWAWFIDTDWMLYTGIFMFGHIALDRLFGYGLKFEDSFHHTHLGWIGKGVDQK